MNLTETHRTTHELNQRAQELQQRNVELRSFAQTVAHDIKGPLTKINFILRMMGGVIKAAPNRGKVARFEFTIGK
ncbi:MAG: hypothetical protein ABJN36_13170 [Cyclobacteriaceae bacterium]